MAGKEEPEGKLIAQNRRARFDYKIEETVEAGLMLLGSEVKSLRSGGASINEAYVGPHKGRLCLFNAYIKEYPHTNPRFQHEARRMREILLHKTEIKRLLGLIQREGYTLVAMSLYFNSRGLAKLRIGLAAGKKQHDKRQSIKNRDWDRQKNRLLRNKNKT